MLSTTGEEENKHQSNVITEYQTGHRPRRSSPCLMQIFLRVPEAQYTLEQNPHLHLPLSLQWKHSSMITGLVRQPDSSNFFSFTHSSDSECITQWRVTHGTSGLSLRLQKTRVRMTNWLANFWMTMISSPNIANNAHCQQTIFIHIPTNVGLCFT